jgi:hypothetical protein
MNVLVIPEDFRKDQYILKPIVEAMLQAIGRRAKVIVCQDPLLGGVDQATKWERIREILDRYRYSVNIFLLIVDRDGQPGRRDALNALERKAKEYLAADRFFLAENAWQEVEVWILAGHDLPRDWAWKDIRQETDPKEVYFKSFAQARKRLDEPGQGRKTLAQEAAKNYNRVRSRCVEDVASLEDRLKVLLSAQKSA